MANKVNIALKGIIENMAWFTGDDGKRYELFGAGGGDELARVLGVPVLGQVPLMVEMREGADVGAPVVVVNPDSEASRAFAAIAERIDVELAPTRRSHPELKLLA
jgi:ATP-binding protein involved in chromosome partitioning